MAKFSAETRDSGILIFDKFLGESFDRNALEFGSDHLSAVAAVSFMLACKLLEFRPLCPSHFPHFI